MEIVLGIGAMTAATVGVVAIRRIAMRRGLERRLPDSPANPTTTTSSTS